MNAAVAHDNVRGAQTGAELGGHGEQPDSRSPAGCVLTGGGAAATDEALHQTVELLQSIEGAHQLRERHRKRIRRGRQVSVGMRKEVRMCCNAAPMISEREFSTSYKGGIFVRFHISKITTKQYKLINAICILFTMFLFFLMRRECSVASGEAVGTLSMRAALGAELGGMLD